jgi:guanosine-diphosphatase
VKPCSFDGVYQPSLMDTFASGKILLLSYFYDRLHPLLPKPESTSTTDDAGAHTKQPIISVSSFARMAVDVCQGKDTWEKRWGQDKEVMDELEGRPEWCLDLTFMHALLRLGYEFADEREVKIGKQIDATELGWALGATLAMVAGEVKCRI